MAGLVGSFLTGVSEVAVPMAMEERRAQIMAKRDKRLHRQAMERDQARMTHDRELREEGWEREDARHEDNMALQERRVAIEEGAADLNAEQTRALIDQAEVALESAEIDLQEKKRIRDLREAVTNSNDPEAQADAANQLAQLLGETTGWDFQTLSESDGLTESEYLVRTNPSTGEAERVNLDVDNATGYRHADIQAVLDANPQLSRDQAVEWLDQNHPERKASGGQASTTAPASESEGYEGEQGIVGRELLASPRQRREGTAQEQAAQQRQTEEQEPEPLASPGEGARTGREMKGARIEMPEFVGRVGQFLSQGPERNAAHFRERQQQDELRPALTYVNQAISQGELPEVRTETQRRLIQQAIDSGQLSEEHERQLREHLNNSKNQQ